MSPVARTWVPPHNSVENPGTDTTRTRSPYFSPNNATAPDAIAASRVVDLRVERFVAQDLSVHKRLDLAYLVGLSGA